MASGVNYRLLKTAAALFIVILSVVLYYPTIEYDFVYDDSILIVNNHDIKELSPGSLTNLFVGRNTVNFLPVRMLVYMVIYHFWQLDPAPYHIVNIALHALNTLLVFVIAGLAAGMIPGENRGNDRAAVVTGASVVAALIFAVHPIHIEAVTWVSGLKDVLSAFFCLAGLLAFMKYRLKGDGEGFRGGFVIALVAFILAVLSKATALAFPLVLLLFDFLFAETARKTSRAQRIQEHVIMMFVMAGLFALDYAMASEHAMINQIEEGGALTHLLNVVMIAPFYLYKVIYPFNLSIIYEFPSPATLFAPAVIASIITLALAAAAFLLLRKRNPAAAFGIGIFFIMLAPTMNVIPFGTLAADRYMYLPLLGICLAAGAAGGKLFAADSAVVKAIAAVVLIAAGAVMIYGMENRNPDWRNPVTLWESTVELLPENPKALASLGGAYLREKRFDDAMEVFEKAMAVDKTYPVTYVGLGLYYMTKGEYEKALDIMKDGLKYGSGNTNLHYNIGIAYYNLGDYIAAARVFDAVNYAKPNYKEVGYYMQQTLEKLEKMMGQKEYSDFLESFRN